MILEGIAHVFGDHLNTDCIISTKYKAKFTDIKQMAEYLMEDVRPGFYKTIKPGDFIVGGINFGCGSSREAAPAVIKEVGISAVLAAGFARIFFRNAINIGLPALQVDTKTIQEGDRLRVDLAKGTVENLTKGDIMTTQPLPPFVQQIVDAGGMKNYFKSHPSF
jgi:3-isopropylmalate/(R)-2-methylmalate dehydratase small subunit